VAFPSDRGYSGGEKRGEPTARGEDTLPRGNKAQASQHPNPAREGVDGETKSGLFGNGDRALIELFGFIYLSITLP